MRQYPPGIGQFRRQRAEQFVLQIVEQGLVGMTIAEQSDAHPGTPTGAELQHAVDGLAGRLAEQVLDFRRAERQFGATLEQFIVEQQAWPVAGRAAARAEPPSQIRAGGGQQAVEQRVSVGRGQAAEIVEEYPGRGLPATKVQQQRGFIGKGQAEVLRQALAQVERAEGHTVERQPIHLATAGGLQGALAEQRALATTAGGAQQPDPGLRRQQRLGQARAQQMMSGQPGHESRTVQAACHGGHCCILRSYCFAT